MYKIAKSLRTICRLIVSLAIACAFGYGFYGLFTYVVPMSQGDFGVARKSLVGDVTEIFLNGAAKDYDQSLLPSGKVDQQKLAEATKVLELELDHLIAKNGKYSLTDKSKLARVYFLLGKCYQRQKKLDKAKESYEDALRLDPDNLPAKYNLEMIQAGGGGGDGGGKQPQGDPPRKI
jgi:tetratricopeptide (TPR) repeat protein